jgi:hypothetical protein
LDVDNFGRVGGPLLSIFALVPLGDKPIDNPYHIETGFYKGFRNR